MIMREDVEEMKTRLHAMGSGDPKWDLSDNDMIAINWALKTIDVYAKLIDRLEGVK